MEAIKRTGTSCAVKRESKNKSTKKMKNRKHHTVLGFKFTLEDIDLIFCASLFLVLNFFIANIYIRIIFVMMVLSLCEKLRAINYGTKRGNKKKKKNGQVPKESANGLEDVSSQPLGSEIWEWMKKNLLIMVERISPRTVVDSNDDENMECNGEDIEGEAKSEADMVEECKKVKPDTNLKSMVDDCERVKPVIDLNRIESKNSSKRCDTKVDECNRVKLNVGLNHTVEENSLSWYDEWSDLCNDDCHIEMLVQEATMEEDKLAAQQTFASRELSTPESASKSCTLVRCSQPCPEHETVSSEDWKEFTGSSARCNMMKKGSDLCEDYGTEEHNQKAIVEEDKLDGLQTGAANEKTTAENCGQWNPVQDSKQDYNQDMEGGLTMTPEVEPYIRVLQLAHKWNAEKRELTSRLKATTESLDEYRKLYESFATKSCTLQAEHANVYRWYTYYVQMCQEHEGYIKSLENEIERMHEVNADLRNEIQELEDQITDMEEVYHDMQTYSVC